MNCGMYTGDNAPAGLSNENGKKLSAMKICNSRKACLCQQPQGVFYLTIDRQAGFSTEASISFAPVFFPAYFPAIPRDEYECSTPAFSKQKNARN